MLSIAFSDTYLTLPSTLVHTESMGQSSQNIVVQFLQTNLSSLLICSEQFSLFDNFFFGFLLLSCPGDHMLCSGPSNTS